MSKKHFIELADMIRQANSEPRSPQRPMFDAAAIDRLARYCASQNPNFKRDRWLDYIAGRCGKNGGAIKQAA